jgi:hypothetical protein
MTCGTPVNCGGRRSRRSKEIAGRKTDVSLRLILILNSCRVGGKARANAGWANPAINAATAVPPVSIKIKKLRSYVLSESEGCLRDVVAICSCLAIRQTLSSSGLEQEGAFRRVSRTTPGAALSYT